MTVQNKEPGSAEREALLAAKECLELALGVREDYPYGRGKPDDELVLQIAERSGFGHLLTLLSAAWRRKARRDGMPDGGEFLVGPCRYTAEQALAKVNAALRAANQAPQAENRWREAYENILAYCRHKGWDVSMRHLEKYPRTAPSSVAAVGAQAEPSADEMLRRAQRPTAQDLALTITAQKSDEALSVVGRKVGGSGTETVPEAASSPEPVTGTVGAQAAEQGEACPYCTSDNEAVRATYFDQTCAGCVARMAQPPLPQAEEE